MALLALIIGFTFAMAISRYDERDDLEGAEATALSAEYERADLLPADAAARVRDLLGRYVQQRILFYEVDDPEQLEQIQYATERLKTELWSAVTGPAASTPTPITALAVTGMNDVLNSEIHTEEAWRFHIPAAAWFLMLLIAIAGNLLLGLSEKRRSAATLVILPVIVSIPFFLIADIDRSARGPHPRGSCESDRARPVDEAETVEAWWPPRPAVRSGRSTQEPHTRTARRPRRRGWPGLRGARG